MLSKDVRYLAAHYPEYIEKVRRNYRWNFIVVALDASFFTFCLALLSQDTIMPYVVSNLTDRSFWVGVVPALYFLGFFFPQLVGAHLVSGKATRKWTIFRIAVAERVGILLVALVVQSLALFSRQQALALLLTAYAVFTITNGLIGPAYSDFVSKNIIQHRGLFYGVLNGLGGLIGFAASLTARHFLDSLSFPLNIQTVLWIAFGASFISPFLIAAYREVPYPVERRVEPFPVFIRAIPGHLRCHPAFVRYLTARAILGVGVMANPFYALHAIRRFELSEGTLGLFTMMILGAQSLLGFLWGRAGDRFGFRLVLALAACLLGAQALLALTARGPEVFFIITFFIGGIYAATQISDPNMIFEIAPPAETSRFIGIANTLLAPVLTLAPLLGGLLVDAFSHQVLFATVLGVSLTALLVILTLVPEPRRGAEGAPAP